MLNNKRLTIAEASALTGLTKQALARRIERGQLRATKDGRLRYIEARELVETGLLDATGAPHVLAGRRLDARALAEKVVETLVGQGIEIYELRQQVETLTLESRQGDSVLRGEIEQARRERAELRRLLEEARVSISELGEHER